MTVPENDTQLLLIVARALDDLCAGWAPETQLDNSERLEKRCYLAWEAGRDALRVHQRYDRVYGYYLKNE